MKNVFYTALIAVLLQACTTGTQAPKNLTTSHDSVSYAIGVLIAKDNQSRGLDSLSPEIMVRAIKDFDINGSDSGLTMDLQASQQFYGKYMRGIQEAKAKIKSEKAKNEGTAFLDENKTKEGVITTASGLQYKVIRKGSGPIPTAAESVVCHYNGTFIDGKVFDSSVKRGQPATFPVSGVIRGWTEALQMMPVGSKWELYIPSDLAYGPRGNQGIPGNSTLIFELDLLDIAAPEKE